MRARVYSCAGRVAAARASCFTAVVSDLAEEAGPVRLVIESREGRDEADRRTIAAVTRAGRGPQELGYEHLRPHEDPLLWIADGVCWAWGAGGDWRRRVERLVVSTVELSPDSAKPD